MSGYRSFAIWGAGNIGARIAEKLLELGPAQVTSVTILTRPESKDNDANKNLAKKGATIKAYDVTSSDAHSALIGVDVLISTVGFGGLALQPRLLRAAHTAGVKLFVPGEWGDFSDGREESLFSKKAGLRREAAELGVPTAAFFNGIWTEWVEELGFDLKNGKITIHGEGAATLSTTSLEDVVRFAVHVLIHLPRAQLENAQFQIEGDRVTFNEIVETLQKASSSPLEVVHRPRAELDQKLKEDPSDAITTIFYGWDTGKGLLPGPLSNDVWPEWKPKKALEILKPLLARSRFV